MNQEATLEQGKVTLKMLVFLLSEVGTIGVLSWGGTGSELCFNSVALAAALRRGLEM
jgi:hypothetical protein